MPFNTSKFILSSNQFFFFFFTIIGLLFSTQIKINCCFDLNGLNIFGEYLDLKSDLSEWFQCQWAFFISNSFKRLYIISHSYHILWGYLYAKWNFHNKCQHIPPFHTTFCIGIDWMCSQLSGIYFNFWISFLPWNKLE